MITKRTWAITGAAAALILVPAGTAYAVTTASDDALPTATERVQVREQARVDQQVNYGTSVGGMYGSGHGDQTQNQTRDQVRDPARDYTRDQVRDQLRDTENCDGDGPMGDGPHAGDDAGRGGMMGGRGSGR